tara:strand:+ start:6207 stop:7562 length:1356 start_codon:yes stop_codon:yes gene_type:complete
MPSVSKSQQRLMGVAYAVKSGSMKLKDVDSAYRDKVKSMVDGMTKKDLKKYASTKHDKLPETVDETYQQTAITPAIIGGMGGVAFPSAGQLGSGDFPHTMVQVADIDDDEEKKKQKGTVKNLQAEDLALTFKAFVNEKFDQRPGELVKDLHFETDPKKAEAMKIELGRRQGEVTTRKQIEGGDYSLRRFRKEIRYGDGSYVGVFMPGSYDAATSKLGDGPHKKAVKKVKWNYKKYQQWVDDVASNDGWRHAYDMAQNAKHEPGLLQWAKKEFRGEDVMQRIQWDIEAYAESVVTEKKLKFKVGDFIKKKKKYGGGALSYEIKAIKPKFNAVEIYLDVTGKSQMQTFQHIEKEWELAESVVNEKKLDREDMMKFVDKYMRIAGTSEEFNGSEGGIWVSGEDMDEFKGQVIYDYYAEGRGYELGVNVKWEKELNKRGWYSEWYDAGTVQIWPI